MRMKHKIPILIFCLLTIFSFTACNRKSSSGSETADTASLEEVVSNQIEECEFDPEEVKEDITNFACDHGLKINKILCYKSDNYFKIDITRITSGYDLQRQYEDAVRDIIAKGNNLNAERMYFNVETVLLGDYGYFHIYITYDYDIDSD